MDERYDRNEQFFGPVGQSKLASTSVAIVGLGGLGSPLAQQLAYLGVLTYSLIDADRITESSLNRVIGAGPSDVGLLKVDAAGREILRIQPEAEVIRIPRLLESDEAFAALRAADFVFGCLDHDGPRSVLVEFCHAYERPYFDLASDIDPEHDPAEYGGRVTFCYDDTGCRRCRAPGLDQAEIDAYGTSARDREAEERAYGVKKSALTGGGPSVVTINGVIASLAATEFMLCVTGVRPAVRELEYRAHVGTVSKSQTPGDLNCYWCHTVRGTAAAADVERFIRSAVARGVLTVAEHPGR